MTNLTTLVSQLHGHETKTGATLFAELLSDTDTIKVTSSADEDSVIFLLATDEQILTVTPLFKLSDIDEQKRPKLFEELLRISPVIPLSSLAIQDDGVIMYGSMSVNTIFENIVDELDTQTDNYSEVLAGFAEYIN